MKAKTRIKPARLLCASALALLGSVPLSASACGMEPYLGQVCTFAFDFCPEGYLPADGRQLTISGNEALYSLLGVRFGGSGAYFNLPDLRGRAAVGTGTADYGSIFNLGVKYGSAAFGLNSANLPGHSHSASANLSTGSLFNGSVSFPVTGGSVSGLTISGSVTVNALNGASAPTSGTGIPSTTNNTVGRVGAGTTAFYPQGTTPIAVPSSHNLTVTGGTISGASASGTLAVPAVATTLPVTVLANSVVGTTSLHRHRWPVPDASVTGPGKPAAGGRLGAARSCICLPGRWPPDLS